MSTTDNIVQANVNNYYFDSWEDYNANKNSIANNSTIYINDNSSNGIIARNETPSGGVQSIDGAIGDIDLGTGLKMVNNTLSTDIETGEVYSTTETQIGKWIDGKPIYRKVFVLENVITTSSNSWTTLFNATGMNIGTIINASIITYTEKFCANILCKLSTAQNVRCWTYSGYDVKIVIIEYTKTTD